MSRTLLRKTIWTAALTIAAIVPIVRWPLQLGLDLRGGASLILRVKTDEASAEQQQGVMGQTRQILERRINAYGLSEATMQLYGNRGNELLVQLPVVSDASRIRNLIQSRAVLEWYSVEEGPYASQAKAMEKHSGILPSNRKLLPTRQSSDGQRAWYLVARPPMIRGTDLRDARTAASVVEQPVTTFILSQEAAKRFEQYTQTHVGSRSAIVLDSEILSVPVHGEFQTAFKN